MQKRQKSHARRSRYSASSRGNVNSAVSLATVRRVPRTRLVGGVVAWAHIPYADEVQEKTRPVVVIRANGRSITVKPATSAASRLRYPDKYVELVDWHSEGFTRPCAVRCQEVEIDVIEIVDIVGELHGGDRAAVLGPADAVGDSAA